MKQIKFPNLYLVGFMGVGKTALGRRVAKELDYQFFDSDKSIEKTCGRSISEIFKNHDNTDYDQLDESSRIASLENVIKSDLILDDIYAPLSLSLIHI